MRDLDLMLRASVIRGKGLAAKDRSGTSDPYVVLTLNGFRNETHCIPKTLDPTWNITFDIPLAASGPYQFQCVCWDKDRFGKDYMGEFEVSLEELFSDGSTPTLTKWFPLISTRKKSKISGEIQMQLTIIDTKRMANATSEQLVLKFGNGSTTATTPLAEFEQTGSELPSEEEDEEEDISSEDVEKSLGKKEKLAKLAKKKIGKKKHQAYEFFGGKDVLGVIFLEVCSVSDLPPERNMTGTSFDMDPFVVVSLGKKTYRTRVIRHCLNPKFDEKMVFQVLRHEKNYSLNFTIIDRDKLSGNDFIADVNFPVQEVIATQPIAQKDTGLYDLPEPTREETVVTSQGSRSRFRLPLSRSSSASNLSKKNNRPEISQKNSSASLTASQSSSAENGASQPSPSLLTPASASGSIPSEDSVPTTGNNQRNGSASESIDYDLKPFTLPLAMKNKERWEGKHSPEIHLKAKYIPYAALRQQFWRVMLRQYDADESGMISRIELTTMLDTLGSTLKSKTIDSFFERFANESGLSEEERQNVELTMDQVIICLEDQLAAQAKSSSVAASYFLPHMSHHLNPRAEDPSRDDASARSNDSSSDYTPAHQSKSQSTISLSQTLTMPMHSGKPEDSQAIPNDGLADDEDKSEEHVIVVKECPLCHQPRLNKRSEVDIVTHLATCASQDWRRVDRLVMGGFVTSSQAQRKWYSKVITKISYGGYKLGANSANILVQDRITGLVQEERMSVYVRLGIRLLYKGLKSGSMEKKKIRKLLESLSVKQGKKFDSPSSARDIKPFIAFHQLDLDEVLLPLDEFKTFNEFFFRALKPDARPVAHPENEKIVVSPADCRSVVFNTIDEATSIWIKGRDFSISRLLGKPYGHEAKNYDGGALGIFRLAPQDYHRFHIPVDGILGEPQLIKGEYYTVNPMAIRSALDVYGENVRIICPIDSKQHGRVMVVCVGAMMVGSTVITAKPGQPVKRGDELGYFRFGGSTLVAVFEPGKMKWDDDLVDNSKTALETLIRVGMSVGHSPDVQAVGHEGILQHVTPEDKAAARRRVEGSLAPQRE